MPAADTKTIINLLFYISSHQINPILEKLYEYDFDRANEEYLRGFIRELISCDLETDRLLQILNYLSTSSKKSIQSLLKIYFDNLEKYCLYDQILFKCHDILDNPKYKDARSVVIDEFFSLLLIDEESFEIDQTISRNALFDDFTDEEFLSVFKDEKKVNLLFTNDFSFSDKLDLLIADKDFKTIKGLIDILPRYYIEEIIDEDEFTYFTLAIYFAKKKREETENYLSKHLSFKSSSAGILFENYGIVDLICQNYLYTPILHCLGTYLYKSRDSLSSKYHNMLNLLCYIVNKYQDSRTFICNYVSKNFNKTFSSIFNCLADNDDEDDVDMIVYSLKETVLNLCPLNLLAKLLVKVSAYDNNYFATLYKQCGDDENLKNIFLQALLNTDVSIENIFNNKDFITTENITRTPLIILLEKNGMLEKLGIKKVDL